MCIAMIIIISASARVAQLAKRRISDLGVTGSRPPVIIRHIRYVLLLSSKKGIESTFVAINLFM